MARCPRCNRELKPGKTIGDICARKMQGVGDGGDKAPKLRIEPLSTMRNYHSYLIFDPPSRFKVKIEYLENGAQSISCVCGSHFCGHIELALERENERFARARSLKVKIEL